MQGKFMRAPRKGACSNIFQIGCIMHALLRREVRYPATLKQQLWRAPFSEPRYSGKFTHGSDLFSVPWKNLYSATLRELVTECLMFEPDDRPTLVDLQTRVAAGKRVATEQIARGVEGDSSIPARLFGHIPMKDPKWIKEPLKLNA